MPRLKVYNIVPFHFFFFTPSYFTPSMEPKNYVPSIERLLRATTNLQDRQLLTQLKEKNGDFERALRKRLKELRRLFEEDNSFTQDAYTIGLVLRLKCELDRLYGSIHPSDLLANTEPKPPSHVSSTVENWKTQLCTHKAVRELLDENYFQQKTNRYGKELKRRLEWWGESLKQRDSIQAEITNKVCSTLTNEDRCHFIAACGAGKSHIGIGITQKMAAATHSEPFNVVVFSPLLTLIAQLSRTWHKHFPEESIEVGYVCSIKGNTEEDISEEDLERCLPKKWNRMFDRTDPKTYVKGIQQFFTGTAKPQTRVRLLFCCYQSSDILVEALKLSPTKVHLGIFDECHRMGNNSAIYNKDGFVIEKRVFMTATLESPTSALGPSVYNLSMRDAIEMKLICDYIAIIIRIESLENFTRYSNKDRIDLSYDALNLPASATTRKQKYNSEFKPYPRTKEIIQTVAMRDMMNRLRIQKTMAFYGRIDKARRAFEIGKRVFKNKSTVCTQNDSLHQHNEVHLKTFTESQEPSIMFNPVSLGVGYDDGNVSGVSINYLTEKNVVQFMGRGQRLNFNDRSKRCYVLVPYLAIDDDDTEEQQEQREGSPQKHTTSNNNNKEHQKTPKKASSPRERNANHIFQAIGKADPHQKRLWDNRKEAIGMVQDQACRFVSLDELERMSFRQQCDLLNKNGVDLDTLEEAIDADKTTYVTCDDKGSIEYWQTKVSTTSVCTVSPEAQNVIKAFDEIILCPDLSVKCGAIEVNNHRIQTIERTASFKTSFKDDFTIGLKIHKLRNYRASMKPYLGMPMQWWQRECKSRFTSSFYYSLFEPHKLLIDIFQDILANSENAENLDTEEGKITMDHEINKISNMETKTKYKYNHEYHNIGRCMKNIKNAQRENRMMYRGKTIEWWRKECKGFFTTEYLKKTFPSPDDVPHDILIDIFKDILENAENLDTKEGKITVDHNKISNIESRTKYKYINEYHNVGKYMDSMKQAQRKNRQGFKNKPWEWWREQCEDLFALEYFQKTFPSPDDVLHDILIDIFKDILENPEQHLKTKIQQGKITVDHNKISYIHHQTKYKYNHEYHNIGRCMHSIKQAQRENRQGFKNKPWEWWRKECKGFFTTEYFQKMFPDHQIAGAPPSPKRQKLMGEKRYIQKKIDFERHRHKPKRF